MDLFQSVAYKSLRKKSYGVNISLSKLKPNKALSMRLPISSSMF